MAEGDGAAVDVDSVDVDVEFAHPRQHDRGERFVDLVQVDLVELQTVLGDHALAGVDRAAEQQVRIGADQRAVAQAGARLETQLFRLALRHPQHRRGAVRDLRRVARRMHLPFLHRPQSRQPLECAGADSLVGVDAALLAGRLAVFAQNRRVDRLDLAFEAPFFLGAHRVVLRAQRELIAVVARDAVHLADLLGGVELVERHVPRPTGRLEEPGPMLHALSETDVAHHFDAAGDADVDGTGLHQRRHQVIGLLSGAALRVDGGAGDAPVGAARQPGVARQVVRLLARLRHATADNLLDQRRVDPRLLDDRGLDHPEQCRGVESAQPTGNRLAAANGRTQRFDDHSFRHFTLPLFFTTEAQRTQRSRCRRFQRVGSRSGQCESHQHSHSDKKRSFKEAHREQLRIASQPRDLCVLCVSASKIPRMNQ